MKLETAVAVEHRAGPKALQPTTLLKTLTFARRQPGLSYYTRNWGIRIETGHVSNAGEMRRHQKAML